MLKNQLAELSGKLVDGQPHDQAQSGTQEANPFLTNKKMYLDNYAKNKSMNPGVG